MSSHWFNRVVRPGLLITLFAAVGVTSAFAGPERGQKRRRTTGFNLRASPNEVLNVNRVFCGINNLGEICVDPTNSPVLGGGFWPKGTPDQYVFNSGLQLAGIVDAPGFAWDGDTTGAYFMDPRGTQPHGAGVTNVFSSLNPDDAANWPNGAVVRDADLFDPVLLGRNTVSQQDVWVRAWDGNPTLLSGRDHPMGILVETRGLAWNFPSGNEDIVYFIYRFYNITASDPAAYAGLDPAIQGEIAQIGADYQAGVESRLGVNIPDGGYAFNNLYSAFFMDPDVGDAGANYSTAILPFSLGLAYNGHFQEASFTFPPEIFGAPFFPAPGFVGVKYLRSPIDPVTNQEVGLTLFSNTLNQAGGFPDPVGVLQLWRYLSGNVSPAAGDNPCTFPNPRQRRLCFLFQSLTDTRFYQSSGPMRLEPGQFQTIVVAYVHAAPVAAPLEASGEIGGDLKPGIPFPGDSIAANTCSSPCVRTIDSIAGWLTHSDDNLNNRIDQDEVNSVPRSLLNKAIVAQAVFDNKFLLPFAPEAPDFFLVPGDNRVTVVWQRSPTEQLGDPFFTIASDAASPLFDENFREFDVEGYRIYRGRNVAQLELIAQFDYSGTTFIDFTGAFDYGNCAPELGITTDCPTFPNTLDLVGNMIQVPPGGRVELANGSVFVINADTAVVGAGFPALTNTGVPFAYVDSDVRNAFTYHYAVTAFDVNSFTSGPSSLESPRITKSVAPRAPGAGVSAAVTVTTVTGDDGEPLDPRASYPPIDTATGTFGGPIPPINSGEFGFLAAVTEALPPGDISVRIDSVGLGWAGGFGPAPDLYVTMSAGGTTLQKSVTVPEPGFSSGGTLEFSVSEPLVPYDSAGARLFGLALTQDVRMPVEFKGITTPMAFSSPSVATASGRYGVSGFGVSRYLSHSRWFDAGGTEPADPTIVAAADSQHNAGSLSGVGYIWAPSAYRSATSDIGVTLRGQGASGQTAWYPADFIVTWNADGSVTVRDTTHRITLPFTQTGGSGWGFLTLDSVVATGMDQATWDAIVHDGIGTPAYDVINYQHLYMTHPTCSDTWWEIPDYCVNLSPTAQVQPLDFNQPDGTADGDGIVLYINGEYFFMETASVPAAGTQWQLRAVSGVMDATCTPSLGPAMTDCSAYEFRPNSRATVVPGLRFNITVEQQYAVGAPTDSSLALVHTVPDPYYVTNALEQTPNTKVLKFVNLPSQAIVRIYSVSGVLVAILEHNDPAGGGERTWNLRNRNNQFVASGVYFYHVETSNGLEKIGRFTVVNFAQ